MLQGEDVKDNNQVISYENGGGYEQEVEFPYSDQLRMAKLELRVKILYKGKTIPFDQPYKLADGVSALYTLATPAAAPIFYDQTYQRITPEQQSAEILFMISKAIVEKKELSKAQVKELEQYISKVKKDTVNKSFQGLAIKAYASPDGPVEFNDKLSAKRGTSTKDAVKKSFKIVKDVVRKPEVTSLGEDWDGFVALVSASNIADKELILRVVSMYSDPNVRDREIKNPLS